MAAQPDISGLTDVRRRLAEAAKRSGRDPAAITLVAVSKTKEAPAIEPVLEAGQRVFGENRVQEAAGKWPMLRQAVSGIKLHLIGPLQTNKTADAVALFDVIESVDREKLASILAQEMTRQSRRLDCFIQINTGAEPQKAGIPRADADRFIDLCRGKLNLPVVGLMCIPPVADDPNPHFDLLADIARRHSVPGLSMGMSGDFEIAIARGATHVRVGSAIFGRREKTPTA
ncbi:MAG TPA: YggS family pyridoxal phosphate-dependent enzyme [Dongiaceae bacterium]